MDLALTLLAVAAEALMEHVMEHVMERVMEELMHEMEVEAVLLEEEVVQKKPAVTGGLLEVQ